MRTQADKTAANRGNKCITSIPADSSIHPLDTLSTIAESLFSDTAKISADVEGVSRPAFSEKESEALRHLESVAEQFGLSVWHDAGQNVLFSLPEDENAEKYVLVGSHIDTVSRGGNFDGLAGIVAGFLCLVKARQSCRQFARPVKVIAMRGEESDWFGPCYIASKCLTGQLSKVEMASRHKVDGLTLREHMDVIGVDVDAVRKGEPLMDVNTLLEYIELHIEQGPLLVEKNIPAAIVSGIRGNLRHRRIRCEGEAGHSGAVPRAYRRDPVMALADLLSRLDESWLTILQKGNDLVLTSGIVSTDPETHSMSRIPGQVTFSLDSRSQSSSVLNEMRELIQLEMAQIEVDRKVRFQLDEELWTSPAMMAETVVSSLKQAMKRTGLEPFTMPSGGGHDAAVFSNAGVPAGMVFVRNRNGSHNPDEAMDISDFLLASEIIYEHLMRFHK